MRQGVGKTETAKALAEFMFDDENAMTRIDMSEFGEKVGSFYIHALHLSISYCSLYIFPSLTFYMLLTLN
jgi:AAA domain (Cdc48 subfamily)